jgi:hypothetical protein
VSGDKEEKDKRSPGETGEGEDYDSESVAPVQLRNPNVIRFPAKKYLKFTPERQEEFLRRFAGEGEHGPICAGLLARTAASLNVSVSSVNYLRKTNEEFAERYKEALQLGNEYLVEVIHDRGVNGWPEPVYGKDGRVGTIIKRDHTLLLALARARLPEMFRDNVNVKHSGKVEGGGGVILIPVGGDPQQWGKVLKLQQTELQKAAAKLEKEHGL